MNPLLTFFDDIAVIAVLGTLWTAWVGLALAREKNRQQIDGWLKQRRWSTIYSEGLTAALDRIDAWMTPRRAPSPEAAEAEGRRSWSWPLFDLSLRLALLYPILSLIIAWAILGGERGDKGAGQRGICYRSHY